MAKKSDREAHTPPWRGARAPGPPPGFPRTFASHFHIRMLAISGQKTTPSTEKTDVRTSMSFEAKERAEKVGREHATVEAADLDGSALSSRAAFGEDPAAASAGRFSGLGCHRPLNY